MILSLDNLRREAKQLKRSFAAGEADAIARVTKTIPNPEYLKHTQALQIIALENGFPSWPRLKLASEISRMDSDARAERLKIALYLGQNWIVEDLLRDDPTLSSHNLGLACALYDLHGVRRTIENDPEAATRIVGIRSPILHLAFSRHHRIAEHLKEDMILIAKMLVDAGADVNDSYPFETGSEHRLSALYGALGHAGNLHLAEWLLEHGANPDDNESLYHATELDHLDGVKLLMRFNVKTSGTNALVRMLDFDNFDGAKLFLDYGADPNEAVIDHPSGQPIDTIPALHQAARRGRDGRFVALLIQYGADPLARWQGSTPFSLASIYGNFSFAEALKQAGYSTELSSVEQILADCASGQASAGSPLTQMSLNDEERRILTRVILWEDHLQHAKALVAAGIDPNVPEEMNMTPLHLAGWAGLKSQVAWLLTLEPDLTHVNDYGGGIIGTIVHGSENRLDTDLREHVACARLALEAGAKISKQELDGALDEEMSAFLHDWVEAHPETIN